MARLSIPGIIFIFVIYLLLPNRSFSQITTENNPVSKELRQYTEGIYRLDDLLVNGKLYRPENANAKGSPYFLNDKFWKKSTLYIKGREFSNQDILYNIENDEIIANIIFPDGNTKNIVLDNAYIDSLSLQDHFFINISPFSKEEIKGLYEQVYDGSFKVLLKHHIQYKKVIAYDTPNGYYQEPETNIFILSQGKLINVSNKNSLLNYFKPIQKEIANYIKKNKIKLKKANVHEFNSLFKVCDDLSKQ